MKQTEKALKQYYRRIGRWLPCAGKQKRQILQDISQTVSVYLLDNPEATAEDVMQHYGTPQQIAASYTDAMDTQQLLKTLRINRRVLLSVGVSCLLLLAMWAAVVTATYIEALGSINGYTDPGYITVIAEGELK